MKRHFTFVCVICFLLATSLAFSAEVNVTPGAPDALFLAVAEANAGDVLVLADGGVYPNSATLPISVPLTIKTVDGAAAKAILVSIANAEGKYPGAIIQADASLTIKDIVCTGQQGETAAYTTFFVGRGEIGSGHMHYDGVEVSRFKHVSYGGAVDTLIVENSLFNGNLTKAGGWGGTFDYQGDIVKYVKIENNTFMFCTFGAFLGTGWGNYSPAERQTQTVIINHNTLYNITGPFGPTTMFNRTEDVAFTNNLYINGTFHPNEFFSNVYADFPNNADDITDFQNVISHLGPKGNWIIDVAMVDSAGTEIDMRANNISFTADVEASWAAKGLEKPWVYTNETKAAIIDPANSYFEEKVTFTNAPAVPMFAVDAIAEICALGNADPAAYEGQSPFKGWDWFNGVDATFDLRAKADMDMSYNTDAVSYTAGTDGMPLGDLNWFPEKKQEWLAGGPSEVFVTPGAPDALFLAVAEANAGDVLVLADGGVYPNSATLPISVPLTIKTVDGAAAKAILVSIANAEGKYPGAIIQADASLTIKDIVCTGQQGETAAYTSFFVGRGEIGSGHIHYDGVEISRFKHVSFGGAVDTLIVENSLFNGNLTKAGGWGGTFDYQGDIVKYVKIENNTFMYCTFGPFLGTGWGNYSPAERQIPTVIINHNTMYNITGAHGPTTMFNRAENVQFTNNIYINGTFSPNEFFSNKYVDFPNNADDITEFQNVISHLGPKGMWIIDIGMVDSAGTVIDMRSNNISFTADVEASWAAKGLEKPWVYTNETKAAIIDPANSYFEEKVTFVNAPAVPMFAVDAVADICALGNADPAGYEGQSPFKGWDWFNGVTPTFDLRQKIDMDMSYNTDAASYTAGTDGLPLGDLNWFPGKKQEWLTGVSSRGTAVQPESFELAQNYPNPFNPSTTISYTLVKAADVNLTVYNMLGQPVKTLVNRNVTAGLHTVKWDGTNANGTNAASGIYYYKLESENHSETMKMMLLK